MAENTYEAVLKVAQDLTELAKKSDREVLEAAVEHLDLRKVSEEIEGFRHQTTASITALEARVTSLTHQLDECETVVKALQTSLVQTSNDVKAARDDIEAAVGKLDNALIVEKLGEQVGAQIDTSLTQLRGTVTETQESVTAMWSDIKGQMGAHEQLDLRMEEQKTRSESFDMMLKASTSELTQLNEHSSRLREKVVRLTVITVVTLCGAFTSAIVAIVALTR